MFEPDTKAPSSSPSHSPSTPRFHLHPNTPEIHNRFPPNIAKRMQEDTCFRCHQQGHWTWTCPLNSSNNNKPLSSSPINDNSPLSPKRIFCRCGYGLCQIKTARNDKNRGSKYYFCPIDRGAKCNSGFIKWCDETIDDSYFQPPDFKYPVCKCSAGVCQRIKEPGGYYFTCPFKLEHGSCGYRVSEDELLNNNPVWQNKQKSLHDFWEGLQNDKTNNDLGIDLNVRRDLLVKTKKMRITDNCESPSLMNISEIPDGEDVGAEPKAAQSTSDSFPEFQVADEDLEFANSVQWDAVEEEVLSDLTPPGTNCQQSEFQTQNLDVPLSNDAVEEAPLSSLSTRSGIRSRQSEFQRDILKASLNACSLEWYGRLLFLGPMQRLKSAEPRPYFCCVFPSFDPIVVPKQASIERNQLARSSISSHTQPSEVSRDVIIPNKSLGMQTQSIFMAQIHKDVIFFTKQRLLTSLESLDPHQHESMRETAEFTFTMLNQLGVTDCQQFYDQVQNFINLASSIAKLDKSMESSLTLEEHHKLLEEEKATLAHIHNECAETETMLEMSNRQRQLLSDEVSRLEAMLRKKQNQLKSCELETWKIETRLEERRRSMLEVDTKVKGIAEKAEAARRQSEEKEAMHIAAKTALEKAKLGLEN